MKNNINLYGCETLSLEEMITITGGDAYEAGYEIGKAIHDFCEGFIDGLLGRSSKN